ncbi:hypothetical protein AB4Y45_09135 [Paraburkholderia sp. EG287A]|uniref:hypothetical protein n=1 Tax=Paraburkholderia sp. EG287A TaxID=3237012 RepID=UPI0034D18A00
MNSIKLLPILAATFAVAAHAQTVIGSDGRTYMVLPQSQPQAQGSIYGAYQRAEESHAQAELLQQQAELLRQQAALLQQQREQMEQRQHDTPHAICVEGTPALPQTTCYQQVGNTLLPMNQEAAIKPSPVASPAARGRKCSAGYQWDQGSCQKIVAPQDGHITANGTGWECNRGFHAIGNLCGPVYVPMNAELDASGHDWRCKTGYRSASTEACIPTGSTR